ncbi:hypothetical protein RvY_03508 [Ramazzottius varieornatus]|uniref:ShKT domain-containing protein n=1 Tax=Ramazzottius varieornatus TaxID=947166 RepID=A0A1D1US32_RAMVA|nr:hypothetical protein RvY_03508 [Ramazzottius varieornatus]
MRPDKVKVGSVLIVGWLMVGLGECQNGISRRTPPAAEGEPAVCADKMRRCKQWARDGDCIINPTYMETNCKKSCHLCDPKIAGTTYTKEKMLKERLLNNYDAKVRPSVNTSAVLDLQLSFTVLHLIDVNEESQMFTVQGYIRMKWNDVRLGWTPSDFNEIMAVSFSSSQIWYPEVNVANTAQADQTYILHDNPTPMMVRNNGDVIWTPRVEVTTLCNFDAKYFPVDTHHCSIIFSPWMQSGAVVNLTLWHLDDVGPQGSLQDDVFQPNLKWRVKSSLGADSDFYHPCCAEPWPVVQVDLTIERNVPVITILMVASVIFVVVKLLLCFVLPIRSIMRFVLSASDCAVSLLLLLHLSNIVPQSSTSGPIIVNVTAALLIESLAVLLYCGLLYHLSSSRFPLLDQALTLPTFFQNLLNTLTKSRTRCTRNAPRQRDWGVSDDSRGDLVDMMFGSDQAHLIDYEVEPEGAHSSQNGDTPANHNSEAATLTNGGIHTAEVQPKTSDDDQLRSAANSSNFALVILLNRLGLAVFTLAFAVELLIVMVI